MRAFLTCLAVMVALASPTLAKPQQHGNVIFDLPAGWATGTTQPDGTLVILSDLPNDECEYCYIYVTSGIAGGGTLAEVLKAQIDRFREEDDPPAEIMSGPEVMNLGGRPAAMMGLKVGSDLQVLVAVQLFGRIELFAFTGSAYEPDDVAESVAVFQRDVTPMLETARYLSEGAQPLMPPPEPGPLTGLYWGYSTGWAMQLDGTMQMQLYHRHLVFWPDGTFYDGTPLQGLSSLDPKPLLAAGDMNWGSYRVHGSTLTLAFASGEVQEISIQDTILQDGDRTMYAVDPLPDGSRIDGSVYSFFFSGFTPGSGISGGVSSSNLISYNPDGTWTGSSSGGAFGNFETAGDVTGGFATGDENAVSGTYEVRDGLIIRHFADGSPPVADLIYKVADAIYIGSDALGEPG